MIPPPSRFIRATCTRTRRPRRWWPPSSPISPIFGSWVRRTADLWQNKGLPAPFRGGIPAGGKQVMARRCAVTGKKPMSGHNVSHANNRTKRRFLPNLITKRIFVPEIGQNGSAEDFHVGSSDHPEEGSPEDAQGRRSQAPRRRLRIPPLSALPVGLADIEAAARRLQGHAHLTPVLTSATIDRKTGGSVFFKCENFQRAGAFKFRGAFNALSKLSADERRRGVLTFSSGNHAQAIALSGRLLSVPTVVVMPNDAPEVKVRATREYGAEVVMYDKNETTREALGKKISDRARPGHHSTLRPRGRDRRSGNRGPRTPPRDRAPRLLLRLCGRRAASSPDARPRPRPCLRTARSSGSSPRRATMPPGRSSRRPFRPSRTRRRSRTAREPRRWASSPSPWFWPSFTT